jgi:hypothetical protein
MQREANQGASIIGLVRVRTDEFMLAVVKESKKLANTRIGFYG